MLFVSGLTEAEQKAIVKSHKQILVSSGFYSSEEIAFYCKDILNEKFLSIEDSISQKLYRKLYRKYFK